MKCATVLRCMQRSRDCCLLNVARTPPHTENKSIVPRDATCWLVMYDWRCPGDPLLPQQQLNHSPSIAIRPSSTPSLTTVTHFTIIYLIFNETVFNLSKILSLVLSSEPFNPFISFLYSALKWKKTSTIFSYLQSPYHHLLTEYLMMLANNYCTLVQNTFYTHIILLSGLQNKVQQCTAIKTWRKSKRKRVELKW